MNEVIEEAILLHEETVLIWQLQSTGGKRGGWYNWRGVRKGQGEEDEVRGGQVQISRDHADYSKEYRFYFN